MVGHIKKMPLVIVCGYPSSGKTTVSNRLKTYLEEEKKKNVILISENDLVDKNKNEIFGDSTKEKPIRSSLRADVERFISRDNIIILDGLNYIKSSRYELFCLIKASKTLHCVVQCCYPSEMCIKWNESRPDSVKYTKEIFDAIVMRFEEPDSRNRWDSPLFTVTTDTELDLNGIYDSLCNRSIKPPNQSTMPQPLSSGNFMHDLDKVTQNIILEILDLQKNCVIGDSLCLSCTNEKIHLLKTFNMAELRKIKRQFINYAKLHPVEDISKLKTMFVSFINNTMS